MRIPSIVPGVSNLGEQFPTHLFQWNSNAIYNSGIAIAAIHDSYFYGNCGADFRSFLSNQWGYQCIQGLQMSNFISTFLIFSYGRVVKDGLGCIWFPMCWQPARKLHHGRPIACHCRFAQGAFPEHINTGWYPSLIAKEDTTLASLLPNDHWKKGARNIQHYKIANEKGYYVAVVRPHFLACQGMCFN